MTNHTTTYYHKGKDMSNASNLREYHVGKFLGYLESVARNKQAVQRIADTLATGSTVGTGTVKAWFTVHHGQAVNTVRLDTDTELDKVVGGYTPCNRVIDSQTRKSYATLDGSRSDYTGTTVVLSEPSHILYLETGQHGNTYVFHTITI